MRDVFCSQCHMLIGPVGEKHDDSRFCTYTYFYCFVCKLFYTRTISDRLMSLLERRHQ